MTEHQPSIVILAGPNGAGKSTVAPVLLRDVLGVTEFVNADDIARDLADGVDAAAMRAGRTMLARIHRLAQQRATFAFETTLASRSFATWLAELKGEGYSVEIIFLWLPSAEFAIERVADRVRSGGHSIPADTIRRRYRRGVRNFFRIYEPLASSWRMYDGSGAIPRVIARRIDTQPTKFYDEAGWARIVQQGTADEN